MQEVYIQTNQEMISSAMTDFPPNTIVLNAIGFAWLDVTNPLSIFYLFLYLIVK